ncbi:hypothetical protein WL73_25625 [Burkholderia ubonensis]|uniref:Uncharacterized protein n=1 Tax=Burkholderia ubonensis TaxID=101571 RepID=A0A119MHR9_9BURK|nr:hypothetical protein WL73_25625 [Burkholderia ubonensis]
MRLDQFWREAIQSSSSDSTKTVHLGLSFLGRGKLGSFFTRYQSFRIEQSSFWAARTGRMAWIDCEGEDI